MTVRLFGALLCGAALLTVVPASSVSAQGVGIAVPGVGIQVGEPDRPRSKSGGSQGGTARATTVKSSKSNTSDRMGGGGGKGAANRMGGGGGKGSANRGKNLNTSRSN